MPESESPGPGGSRPGAGQWNALRKRRREGRLKGSMAALSAAAIVSVYAVGYWNTQDTGTRPSAAAPDSADRTTATPSGRTEPRSRAVGTPTPAAKPSGASASVSYSDGTFVGTGSSRHGSIQATVIVRAGQIVSADITGCQTRYPCSRVSQLPSRVVAAQSSRVNYVSGATDSSRAYMGAVAAALKKAQAPS